MTATTLPRIAACQFCAGAGVLRATFEKPSGKCAKPRIAMCPECAGKGAQLVRPRQ